MTAASYDADAIVVLSDIDAIRKRPAMYVGSTGADGWHQLIFELLDNAVDEAVAGHCREIWVTLEADGWCSVRDDGRGIPVDWHADAGRPAAEIVLTRLHSGAKFGAAPYSLSSGLHGVGLTCVNALSEALSVTIEREGRQYAQQFARGVALDPLREVAPAAGRGTSIRVRPDPTIFGPDLRFSRGRVAERCHEIACLNPGLTLHLDDHASGQSREFASRVGVAGLLPDRDDDRRALHDPLVVRVELAGLVAHAALQWTSGHTEDIRSFVNTVRTVAGGTHVEALKRGLTRAVNRYAETQALVADAASEPFAPTDVLEGLGAVVAVRMQEPAFDGQIKARLVSDHAGALEPEFDRHVTTYLTAEREAARPVLAKIQNARRARLAVRRAPQPVAPARSPARPPLDVYRRQFGERSRNWHDSCSWLTDAGLLAAHAACCAVGPEARMLDVCCGSGVVGASFGSRVAHKVGLDITPEMQALARLRLDDVKAGSVYDIPFAAESFDIVVTREVLHILPDPERPLREMFRVLKPGGQIVLGQTVPYGTADAAWMFCVFRKKQPLFCNHLLAEDLAALLGRVGFDEVTLRDYYLWESIDVWIDTHETSGLHREEIRHLFRTAPDDVRAMHPFEILPDGQIRDCWRWCIASARKTRGAAGLEAR